MRQNMTDAGQSRTPQVAALQGDPRMNAARRVRKALPWGMRGQWNETLKALESSALFRNIVAMSADCTTDDGRYAVAEELMDAIDRRLTALGKPALFSDRVRSLNLEISETTAALTEVLLQPNDPNAKARAKEELEQLERAADQLGDELA